MNLITRKLVICCVAGSVCCYRCIRRRRSYENGYRRSKWGRALERQLARTRLKRLLKDDE